MRRPWTTWVAWGLWAFDVVVVASLLSFGVGGSGDWGSAAGALFIAAFATTGAAVSSRVPENPVGWILCLAAFSFSVGGLCEEVSSRTLDDGDAGVAAATAAVVGTFVWILGLGPAATLILLLFPDGHLPSRRWRPVGWTSAAAVLLSVTGLALTPGTIAGTQVVNPVGLGPEGGITETMTNTGLAVLFVSILACCASLLARYRSAAPEQRQQLKWLAWSVPMVLTWLAASIVVESTQAGDYAIDIANALSSLGLSIVPVSIAVAILRHRLYDIDVVINRTLVYGALTAALVAVYLGLVLTLRLALNPLTGESDLAVAASTLAVAALFRPLRSRIQGVVDRRFFRSRYDAHQTLETFSATLRQQVDLRTIGADLLAVVHDTMSPTHVSLWTRGTRDD